ncbi:MAG: DUF4032 domain-containing protein [Spirochaetaceae bacterium]|jgi:hypothetical protein|nr:DUF4032 domain-containing protein [Spirochaetaceae bacterium]
MGIIENQTENDFFKARNKAVLNDLQHLINPEETELLSFNEIKSILKPKNEVYLGMQVVSVSLIVGSEGRYRDFDNHFFPRNIHLKNRWKRIDEAHLTGVILPPIKLYEIGGLYFVRDGNHRVSVAKAQGVENIDAEVVCLQSEIKLKPGLTKSQLFIAVISYEKRVFYAETAYGDITDDWRLDFTSVGQYDVIYNHILIHKYYINEHQTEEVSMPAAIQSWYDNVYLPVIKVIHTYRLLRKFKRRTPSDLYVWIIRYWDELKEKYDDHPSLDQAALDFTEIYGKGFFKSLLNKVRNSLR